MFFFFQFHNKSICHVACEVVHFLSEYYNELCVFDQTLPLKIVEVGSLTSSEEYIYPCSIFALLPVSNSFFIYNIVLGEFPKSLWQHNHLLNLKGIV